MITGSELANIYRSNEFSLSKAALDHVRYIRGRYLDHAPNNPPVLAGISTGYQLGLAESPSGQVIIGFWTQSEVSSTAWEDLKVVEIEDVKFLFVVVPQQRSIFLDAVIDYSPERSFFLSRE